jgi:hypothetical protein
MTPASAGLRLDLTGVMDDEDSATMVAGSLSLLNGIAGLVQAGNTRLTIRRTGRVVWVRMHVPDSAVKR